MAKQETCDLCGEISPHNGLWRGNNWLEVKVYNRSKFYTRHIPDGDYLICDKCMSGKIPPDKEKGGIGLIVSKISVLLGLRQNDLP